MEKRMQDFIFILTFALGVWAWVVIAKKMQARGSSKLVSHLVAGVIGILIMGSFAPPSEKEKAEKAAAEQLAKMTPDERAAHDQKIEDEKLRVAAEKAAAEKAEADKKALAEANRDRSSEAFVYCRRYVERSLKAPSTADFPWSPDRTFILPDQTYVVKSYVDAQNGFGAMIRSQWHCKIKFMGGETMNVDNWQLKELEII